MFDFETIHKNHKLAYLDGLLCGVAITAIGMQIYKDLKESRALERLAKETDPK